ncbi:hypothetical protein [Flexivirga caeni]|uniref:Glycosyltransferase RgtA/B/C/D-like domain-containing protein n=1 Tax=Flexivirga caeni TaxID=2294115 RepID=A0A3M9LVH8_9MICO|nr:hypothetical protein [Flexivirga caeni]RNI17291.1 hypothetical protein EFY87_19415 [Flexivirga caeni]
MASPADVSRPAIARPRRSARVRRTRSLALHPATLLSLLCAVPVVVAAARAIAAGWLPVGDDAIVAARIQAVFSAHPPLVGMRSTSGNTQRSLDSHHPGPLEFYLDAPVSALFHYSATGIVLSVALVNLVCVVGTVVMAYRLRRLRTAVPVAGALLLAQWLLGPDVLARPLNPYAGILSVLLMLVAAWAVLDRDPHGPWVMLLAGSFAAQVNLAFCPVVVAVMVVALGCCAARVWRNLRTGHRSRSWRSRAAARKRVVVATCLTVLAWLPPIVELFVIHPNNVQLVWQFATADSPGEPSHNGMPAGARFVIGHLSPTALTRLGNDFTTPPSGSTTAAGLVVLVLLLLAATAGPRLPRTAATRGCWVVLAAVIGESTALSRMPADLQQSYWQLPVLVITPLAYAVLAVRCAELLADEPVWRRADPTVVRRVTAAGTAALVAASVLAAATARAPSRVTSMRSRVVIDAVQNYLHDHARPGVPVRIESAGLESFITLAPAVGFQLMRDGHPARFLLAWSYPEDISSWDLNVTVPHSVIVTLADSGSVHAVHPGSGAASIPLPAPVGSGVLLWIDIPPADRS